MKNVLIILVCIFTPMLMSAQLDDFCSGDRGEPIFLETFGDQTTTVDPNAIGMTTYNYAGSGQPNDGSYTISSRFNWFDAWFDTNDHTEGDQNGRALIVNADDNTAGQFFEREITGLCPGTTYEFSTWLLNLSSLNFDFCGPLTGIPGGIPINVRFEIWDEVGANILVSGSTGDVFGSVSPIWKQYGLTFKTVSGQNGVILRILNNGIGGCGNDLALDDIQFVSCGDKTEINSSIGSLSPAQFCDQSAGQVELEANTVLSVFTNRFYQWQESTDGISFTDIATANNDTYLTENLVTEGDYYYRVRIAETLSNLSNNSCSSVSEEYLIQIRDREIQPLTMASKTFCEGEVLIVEAVPQAIGQNIRWYDQSLGGSLLFEGIQYTAGKVSPGNYEFYAEAYNPELDCPSVRSQISVEVFSVFSGLQNESLFICPGEEITLIASNSISGFDWSTGESTSEIIVSEPGEYTVKIVNENGCSGVEKFSIMYVVQPAKIKSVESDEDSIIITPELSVEDYEYSLDGLNYQSSPVFRDIATGTYTVFIRDMSSCNTFDQKNFFHLYIPKLFSPNGDGIKDEFVIDEVKTVSIFNRYGRLIKQGLGGVQWDGTYIGKALVSDSYWYLVETNEGQMYKGFFTLKR